MAKHLPSVVFCLRRDFKDFVCTFDEQRIQLVFGSPGVTVNPTGFVVLSRADARLLVKRINRCLEASK